MSAPFKVAIIGAGPAGMFLAHILKANGVDAVVVERRDRDYVEGRVRAGVLEEITVDLMTKQVHAGDLVCNLTVLESARSSLTTGNWDFLGQLLEGADAVKASATQLPYMRAFKA